MSLNEIENTVTRAYNCRRLEGDRVHPSLQRYLSIIEGFRGIYRWKAKTLLHQEAEADPEADPPYRTPRE